MYDCTPERALQRVWYMNNGPDRSGAPAVTGGYCKAGFMYDGNKCGANKYECNCG